MAAAAAAGDGDVGGIGGLPEEVLSHVLSLTSPRDACRSAAVSPAFLAAAESDLVWGRFLPPDCGEVLSLSAAASSLVGASKKELYLRLYSVPIDGGKKIFALDRTTGRKRYTLSARALDIVWGDTPYYWRWMSLPESRFAEVAELLGVCWLEIRGRIHTRMLSPKTTYAAYLIFKLTEASNGLTYPSQEATIKLGSHTTSKEEVCLHPLDRAAYCAAAHVVRFRRTYGRRPLPPPPSPLEADEKRRVPSARGDDWMEILIGEFFNNGGDDEEVDMSVTETEGGHWKAGLVVEGIEVRPKTWDGAYHCTKLLPRLRQHCPPTLPHLFSPISTKRF